jgi:antitoxin (DNA-binding transcriptional repressor) of toxin-antitoxin stability system
MEAQKVGVREFREQLAKYLESTTPVAVTRHGETIGYYIPTKQRSKPEALEALRIAGQKVDAMLAAAGVTEDDIVADFKEARRRRRSAS